MYNKTMKKVKQFIMRRKPLQILGLIVAGIINATGVVLLLSSAGLLDGGLSGTAMFIDGLFVGVDILGIVLVLLNVPFFALGFKKLGIDFIVNSAIAIGTYALMSSVYQNVLKLSIGLAEEMFLSSVFGGLLSGIGSGLTIRFGGAMDGMEATAVMFAKKIGLTVGQFVMAYNAILYVIAGITSGDFTIALYSVVAYVVGLKAVDFVVDGLDKGKGCFIVTNKGEKVAGALSEEFGRGVTIIATKGYHSRATNVTIYCVVNRFEIGRLKNIVAFTDPNAFVTINDISEVLGNSVKLSKKKKVKKKVITREIKVEGEVIDKHPFEDLSQNTDQQLDEKQ